jgi:hypothetical protein
MRHYVAEVYANIKMLVPIDAENIDAALAQVEVSFEDFRNGFGIGTIDTEEGSVLLKSYAEIPYPACPTCHEPLVQDTDDPVWLQCMNDDTRIKKEGQDG